MPGDREDAAGHLDRGRALLLRRRPDAALEALGLAASSMPEAPEVHAALGDAYRLKRDLRRAEAAYERALALDPLYAQAFVGLGAVAFMRRRFEESERMQRKALLYDRTSPDAIYHLARAQIALGRIADALQGLRDLVSRGHANQDVMTLLGVALNAAGNPEAAARIFAQAVTRDPTDADARMNLAHARLLAGDWAAGWSDHEWRASGRGDLDPEARWTGEDLGSKGRLLLWAEQGLGDTIQFLRYAPMAAARAGRVILRCPTALHRLARGVPGIGAVTESVDRTDYDAHCPLMSLPYVFATREETVPAKVPYLPVPEPMALPLQLSDAGSDAGAAKAMQVGLVWAGNPKHARDWDRSRPLADFAVLADVGGVRFHALQKGPQAAEAAPEGLALSRLGAQFQDMHDTAAALAALDLLISVDTSVAHLAGALGRPVWLLLPAVPDWRWMLGRADSPWYPTMRLFRATAGWPALFEEVRDALAEFAEQDRGRSRC